VTHFTEQVRALGPVAIKRHALEPAPQGVPA
jgi:hypothetical protein